MTDFSQMTSKIEIVIACGGDDAFFQKMEYASLLATTREIPTEARRLFSLHDELIFSYSAIITIKDDIAEKFNEEQISQALEDTVIQLVDLNCSPLLTNTALLCKISNTSIIDAFCELHKLNKDVLNTQEDAIVFWSTSKENKQLYRGFKPSNPALFKH